MPGWIPPRLRSLLGEDLDAVGPQEVERLLGLAEDTDLEFKTEMYGTSDGQTKEAAYDAAALANAGGGLLIIGMEEDGAGVASALSPIDDHQGRDIGLWFHQVFASRISPPIRVTHRALPMGDGFVHDVAVAPSIYTPHGVAVGAGAIRFPLRTGTTRRWLSEAELADRYRRRFAAVIRTAGHLDRLHGEVLQEIPDKGDERWAWLIITMIPDLPGRLDLRRGVLAEWEAWFVPALNRFPSYGRGRFHASLAFRSINLHDVPDPNEAIHNFGGRLGADGDGFLLFGFPGGRGMLGAPESVVPVYDEHLIGELVNGIGALSEHAVRCGAGGDAQVSAEIVSRTAPMIVSQYRSRFPGQLADTRHVEDTTGVSRHTVPLASSSVPGSDQLASARLLAVDLGSAFGLPEPQQITANIELVRNRFQKDWQQRLEEWAANAGVPLIEDLG